MKKQQPDHMLLQSLRATVLKVRDDCSRYDEDIRRTEISLCAPCIKRAKVDIYADTAMIELLSVEASILGV